MDEKESKDELTITISRRTARTIFYASVVVLGIYAVISHQENVMWRETAGRILADPRL